MTVTLPYPPSTNRLWRNVNGMTIKSKEARQYHTLAGAEALRQGMRPIVAGDVAVTIDLYRPRKAGDVGNREKIISDALNGIAYTDDKQIKRLTIERHDTDRHNPRAVVTVEPITFDDTREAGGKSDGR